MVRNLEGVSNHDNAFHRFINARKLRVYNLYNLCYNIHNIHIQTTPMSKNSHKSLKHGPSVVMALAAILIPLFAGHIVSVPAASIAGDTSRTFVPSFARSLFDSSQYRLLRREAHSEKFIPEIPRTEVPTSSSSSSSSSSVSVTPALEEWTIDDLSSTERDALNKQLRSNACPQSADARYLRLCERLLRRKLSTHPAAYPQGLRNPNQQ